MIVYMLTCRPNGKRYIGITKKTAQRRFWNHCSDARFSQIVLHRAIRKYGQDAFSIETLYEASSVAELKAVERGLIAQYGTIAPRGYNCTSGGDGIEGYSWTKEQRDRHSLAMKHRRLPDDFAIRQSVAQKAARAREPERYKLSDSLKMKGKRRGAAENAKRADSVRSYWQAMAPEEKAKRIAAMRSGKITNVHNQ